jgi:chromate transporter
MRESMIDTAAHPNDSRAWREVFPAFLRLGLTSFGGPVAHLAYFRAEFVGKRRWLDEAAYADLVALCQFLPGPASSEVGIALGWMRAGLAGAFAAWLGFTAPSAAVMILFGYGIALFPGIASSAALHGLKLVAVAVVAQAVIAMARVLAPDMPRALLALCAAAIALLVPATLGQIAIIAAGGLIGGLLLPGRATEGAELPVRTAPWAGWVAFILFVLLLIGLPVGAALSGNHTLAVIDGFYRSGALVFGGGHVVLPLLQASVVPPGWVSNNDFLAGYGAAQAVPGPLFTFAAYLGAAMSPPPHGWLGGLICLAAIFLPSFLLVFAALPVWSRLRATAKAQSALAGINASVIGLLAAALYNPVWTSAIFAPIDVFVAAIAFVLLTLRAPPWAVVALGAGAGAALGL